MKTSGPFLIGDRVVVHHDHGFFDGVVESGETGEWYVRVGGTQVLAGPHSDAEMRLDR